MSDETQTEDEPSIEEILDSIRQIISEDDEAVEDSDGEIEETAPEPEPEPEVVEEAMDQSAIDDIDFDAPLSEPEEAEQTVSDEDDILDLTDIVNAEDNDLDIDLIEPDEEIEPEPEPEVEAAPEPEPEPTPEPEPVVEDIPEPEPEPVQEEVTEIPPVSSGDTLLTQNAEAAAVSAMTELVRRTAVEHGSVTIEEIVRSELKPLLREWLDKYLPSVIERLVQEELERVTKRVLED